jgi:HAE1 family hydrophobic/amphiphilic exporter-1
VKVSHFAVKHPVVIGMLLIVLVAFGIFSVVGMNTEFMSDISLPSVEVVTIYPGAGAADVEEDITSILEDNFVTLPNFKSVDSLSANSVSWITITFQDGVDPYDQLNEVRNRIDQVKANLPDGIQGDPEALVGGAEMLPVFTFSISGGADTAKLTSYVEDTLKPQITQIPGVADVSISGGKTLRVNVKLRIEDLTAKGISVANVYQILNYGNVQLPIGSADYKGRTIDVRYEGGFSTLDDIKELPVGMGDDNVVIRLGDVADVTLSYPDPEYYVDSNGQSLVVVDITKRSDGNTVDVAKQVKKILKESEKETGGAVTYQVISDDSRTVNASLSTVIQSGISGIIMAVLVIFLFLNDLRATLIIGLSIPLSILFTFIGMRVAGISINLMSLSGLVVALGMVVDGSIVMLEQVYRYYRKGSYAVENAIFRGADEVGTSIFASTATTVVVFIPIAMLSGIVGMILKDVSMTLILALVASFLVAVVVVPFLMKMILKPGGPKLRRKTLFNRGIDAFENGYRRALGWAMRSWKFIVLLSVCVLVLTLFIVSALGMAFIPSTDNGDFYVNMEFPNGYSLQQTREKVWRAEKLIREQVPEIESAVFYTGQSQKSILGSSSAHSAYGKIVLVPVKERDRDIHDIILLLQGLLSAEIPDATIEVPNGGVDKLVGYVSGGGGYGLTLVSEDLDLLYETAMKVEDELKTDPSVVTTYVDTSFDTNTMVIDMSHEYMNSLGITSYEAGITTGVLFQGVDAGRFRNTTDGNRYDIRLFSDITDRPVTMESINDIQIVSMAGTPVSFANLADVRVEQSVSRINHSDRAKTITVSANLVSEDTTVVNSHMNAWLAANPLPSGVTSKTGGIMELIGDSIPPMITALAIAWFLVYVVMVLQFERFRQPLLIMATIPFCIIGIVLGLLMFGSTMSLIALLGVISLGGVVVNNGIILIDYVNLLREQRRAKLLADRRGETLTAGAEEEFIVEKRLSLGRDDEYTLLRNCVADGSASRIRPIFMTTLTTMLGVVPMAVSSGEGAEIYAPLGQAIAGGLLTSTLITLFIIPVLYYVTEKHQVTKFYRKKGNAVEATGRTAPSDVTVAKTVGSTGMDGFAGKADTTGCMAGAQGAQGTRDAQGLQEPRDTQGTRGAHELQGTQVPQGSQKLPAEEASPLKPSARTSPSAVASEGSPPIPETTMQVRDIPARKSFADTSPAPKATENNVAGTSAETGAEIGTEPCTRISAQVGTETGEDASPDEGAPVAGTSSPVHAQPLVVRMAVADSSKTLSTGRSVDKKEEE